MRPRWGKGKWVGVGERRQGERQEVLDRDCNTRGPGKEKRKSDVSGHCYSLSLEPLNPE